MTPYRIWSRYDRVLLTAGPRAGRIAEDSWRMYPEQYVSREHAEQAAAGYKRNDVLRRFAVLPDGEQPT